MSAREIQHLRLPVGVVGCKFMHEDDGRPASRLLEIQADIVAGGGIGHLTFLFLPSLGPTLKIAVNARGCNKAESDLFRHEMIVESPQNRSFTATSNLALAMLHRAKRTPGCRCAQRIDGKWGVKED
jgi:hypothetical protein